MNKFERVKRFKGDNEGYIPSIPRRSTSGSAGYDFEVAETTVVPSYWKTVNLWGNNVEKPIKGPIDLNAMGDYTKLHNVRPTLVPTGIKCQINEGYYLKLVMRSSTPLKYWLILANGEGVIDRDYYGNPDNDGEIFFQVINLSPVDIVLNPGDKIGQGIFVPYSLASNDCYEHEIVYTRIGGFGSTDNKEKILEALNGINFEKLTKIANNININNIKTESEDEVFVPLRFTNELPNINFSKPHQLTLDEISENSIP